MRSNIKLDQGKEHQTFDVDAAPDSFKTLSRYNL